MNQPSAQPASDSTPAQPTDAPNLFIVGAPKCGTSSMYEYLSQHPDVFMSPAKEPHHFGSDLDIIPDWRIADRAAYLQLFARGVGQRYRGEASNGYLRSELAASEIHAFDPQAKIIAMVRNPVDMMYSLHGQHLWTCNENIENFAEALAAEADRREGRRIPPDAHEPGALQYRRTATFSPQLKRYFDVFGREHVHVVVFDDLAADPAGTYRQALRYLELPDHASVDLQTVNAAKPLQGRFIYRTWRRHRWLRRLVSTVAGPGVRRRVLLVLPKLLPGGKRPKIDPALRAQLQAEFRPEVQRLSELLSRDLTHWCQPASEKRP